MRVTVCVCVALRVCVCGRKITRPNKQQQNSSATPRPPQFGYPTFGHTVPETPDPPHDRTPNWWVRPAPGVDRPHLAGGGAPRGAIRA